MNKLTINIAKINPNAIIPEYKTDGAACFDISICEDVAVEPNQTVLLPTGLVIETPPDYALFIAPRSSMAKTGLIMPHSFGILDPDYCGPEDEMKILVKNITDQTISVTKGQRLAQGYFLPIPKTEWNIIDKSKLKQSSRGGFGSTGSK
ncbi:MAG: dUTP diphosphatase [Patescibacteria group bacterium]|jgi:dUTP pyrophosphatase